MRQEATVEIIKTTPAIIGTVSTYLTLNGWIALATFIYIIVQVVILLHRHYYFVKNQRKDK